uniref:Protein quaking-B n=1 Tax=Schistosoma haematobium TaxID=6185 RepID=A0A094ZPM3_SCHHA
MIRGRGSMRDQTKVGANFVRPNSEHHLNDNLHVLITVEDYENRAKVRLEKASEYISMFLQESVKVNSYAVVCIQTATIHLVISISLVSLSDNNVEYLVMRIYQLRSYLRKIIKSIVFAYVTLHLLCYALGNTDNFSVLYTVLSAFFLSTESRSTAWPINFTKLSKFNFQSKRNTLFDKSITIGHTSGYISGPYTSPALQHGQHFLPFPNPHLQDHPQESHQQRQQQQSVDIPTGQSRYDPGGFSQYHYQNNFVFPSPGSCDLDATMYLHNDSGRRGFTGYFGSNCQHIQKQTLSTTPSIPMAPLAVSYWSCTYPSLPSPDYPFQHSEMNRNPTTVNTNSRQPCHIHEHCPSDNVISHSFINSLPQSNYTTPLMIHSPRQQCPQSNQYLPFHGKQLVTSNKLTSQVRINCVSNSHNTNQTRRRHHHQNGSTYSGGSVEEFHKRLQKHSSGDESVLHHHKSEEFIHNSVIIDGNKNNINDNNNNNDSNNNHSLSIGALKRNPTNGIKKFHSDKCKTIITTSSSSNTHNTTASTNTIGHHQQRFNGQASTNENVVITSRSSHNSIHALNPTDIAKVNNDNNIRKSTKNCLNEQEQQYQHEYYDGYTTGMEKVNSMPRNEYKKNSFKSRTNHTNTTTNTNTCISHNNAIITSTINSVTSRIKTINQDKKYFIKNTEVNIIKSTPSNRKLSDSSLKPIGLVTDETEWPRLGTSVNSLQTSTVNNSQRSSSKLNVVLNDDVGDNNNDDNNAQSITLSHNSKSNSLDIDDNNKVEINHQSSLSTFKSTG